MADFDADLIGAPTYSEFEYSEPEITFFFMGIGLAPIEPTPPPILDSTPPEVTNFDPVGGTGLGRNEPVSFDVTDDSGVFRRILVFIEYEDLLVTELVHDGDEFVLPYRASGRITITNGFRYFVRRSGGWRASPNVRVWAVDERGNEA